MKRTKNKEMLPLLFHEEEGSIFFVAHLFGGLMFAWMAAKSFALQPPMEWERGTFVLLVMGFGCIAGAVSSLWRGRTMGVLLLNLLAPFGILAAISAGQQGAAWVKGPFVLWAVVMGAYGLWLQLCAIRSVDIARVRLMRAIQWLGVSLESLQWLGAAAGMVGILLISTGKTEVFELHPERTQPAETAAALLEDRRELLLELEESRWAALKAAERLGVLEQVLEIESAALGLGEVPALYGEPQIQQEGSDLVTVGRYMPKEHAILLNERRLMSSSAEECVKTVLHESFHAAQHRYKDFYATLDEEWRELIFLQRGGLYYEEFSRYTQGEEDYAAYYDQIVEQEARQYAAERVAEYEEFF